VLPAGVWASYLFGKADMIRRRLFVPLEARDPIPTGQVLPDEIRARNCEMYRLCVREFVSYRPRRFPGKVTVFRAAEPVFDMYDPLPLWRRIADDVEVFTTDGNHGTIMDDSNVNGLAVQLGRCLARVDSGADARLREEIIRNRKSDETNIGPHVLDLAGEPDFAR
jgi:hypothetical protein